MTKIYNKIKMFHDKYNRETRTVKTATGLANNWLEENANKKIVDIKFQVTGDAELGENCNILIHYQEMKD